MKIFVTGGTGFVGHEILRQLSAAEHRMVALVRPGSESRLVKNDRISFHPGDLTRPETLGGGLQGCEAVLHLVGIIREFPGQGITFDKLHTEATRAMVRAAQSQGVRRYLQMSANGARSESASAYHRSKWEAEQAVRQSGLDWTIFRPSLIFGAQDQFVNMLADLIRKTPVVPVIGDGTYRMNPVAVEDVATGFVRALQEPRSIGQTYHCGGPRELSYDELLDLIGRALGKEKVHKLHHPVALVKPVIRLFESFPHFPITSTQLTMLLEGNTCDPAPWAQMFDLRLTPFFEGISRYLQKEPPPAK
jgi:uncharacterized protein YbjT (DUF2867 family)